MAMLTTCPACHTRFRVTPEQLEAHRGDVRCGRCAKVFNARAYLEHEAEPAEQPEAEATPPETSPSDQAESLVVETAETFLFEVLPEPSDEPRAEDNLVPEMPEPESLEVEMPEAAEPDEPVKEETAQAEAALDEIEVPAEPPSIPETLDDLSFSAAFAEQAESTAAEKKEHAAAAELAIEEELGVPVKSRWRWLWLVGIVLLLLALAAQGLYFFRTELAARHPQFKPFLQQFCGVLRCTIRLPANPDLLSIETSSLEADPQQASLVVLNAILRNRAKLAQEYPQLELTLTDTQDKVVARRIFSPLEYAKNADLARGMAPNEDVTVRLNLDLGDQKATGYRVLLFYPH